MSCENFPKFPPFDLSHLLQTVFKPQGGEQIALLIDLPEPITVENFSYLRDPRHPIQHLAHRVFYTGLREGGVMAKLGLQSGDLYAYKTTGGSNLDLPETAYGVDGQAYPMDDLYRRYNLFLAVTSYSATAPLTTKARQFGFRGATLHGLNETILRTGLAVDYHEVSATAERLRLGMTHADWFEIDFQYEGKTYTLHLQTNGRPAQKAHGLARENRPDVVNLPGGEVYFVPAGAEGFFPRKYEDGTIGLLLVEGGRVRKSQLLRGNPQVIEFQNFKLSVEPMAGLIGELGFGTQLLPPAGCDIQDEKIFGTIHVATGRSDHLGGDLSPGEFKVKEYATHDDILFAPFKTPEIALPQVRMHRHGVTTVIYENYSASDYLWQLRNSQPAG